jgi:hypothetical protein
MQRVVHVLIGPRRGHRHDPACDLANRPPVLAGHLRGGTAVLAIPGVVHDQDPTGMRQGGRITGRQFQTPRVDLFVVPARL